jgi:integrase
MNKAKTIICKYMKYDFLKGYKQYLYENLKKNTAKTYYSAVNKVFRDIRFNDLSQIPDHLILGEVRKLGNKNQVSAAKNGLKHLKKYDGSLNLPTNEAFSEISKHKRNYVKSKGKKVDFDLMQRKVNAIRNKKLKLAFRLASISGLRVSELADLETGDLKFSEDGNITVSVRNGKGSKSGQVECLKDKYVCEQLKEYCNSQEDNNPLFYSESYMREKAGKMGIEMHDFRRAFAVLKKMDCMDHGYTAYEANSEVQEGLRHERFSTTKRYLYGRKIVTERKRIRKTTREDNEEDQEPVPVFKSYSNEEYNMASTLDSSDLSDDEKDVLHRYSESDYEYINKSLYIKDYPSASHWKEDIKKLTECIDRKEILDNLLVYRGIRDSSILFGEDASLTAEELNDKYKGSFILHKNFMSTSINKKVSDSFAEDCEREVILSIKLPKGKKGIFMGEVSEYPQETEILVQRNSVLEIESVINNDGNLLVNALIRGQINVNKEGE